MIHNPGVVIVLQWLCKIRCLSHLLTIFGYRERERASVSQMSVSDFTTIEFLDEENNGEMGGGGLRIILLYNVSLVKLLYISLIVYLFQ